MKIERPKPKKAFIVGIDGGVNTGVAVYSNEQNKFIKIATLDFWKAYDFVLSEFTPENVLIVIEWLSPKAGLYQQRDYGQTQKGRDKRAANVGAVRRETTLLIQRFESLGFEVKRQPPPKTPKWDQAQLERFTFWTARTSEHGRDAARIAYFAAPIIPVK